jgi:hypothetical protein
VITITRNGTDCTFKCQTYKQIATIINETMGCPMVSHTVITNWLSRDKKSPKYNFITIH